MTEYWFIFCDAPEPYELYFQDPASPIASGIIQLHDSVMYYEIIILIIVSWILITILNNEIIFNPYFHQSRLFGYKNLYLSDRSLKPSIRDFNHDSILEIIWTILPAFILILIGMPSFKLLYLMDEVIDPNITLKCIGHQWYWSYELSDNMGTDELNINFDSYIVPTDSLEEGELRLLSVDNVIILPINTVIRILVTGADVIHSWSIPSLGIKLDAIPGRLNQAALILERTGNFRGMCYELCGSAHSQMPIVLKGVNINEYISYLLSHND